jgi:hypothetical protein
MKLFAIALVVLVSSQVASHTAFAVGEGETCGTIAGITCDAGLFCEKAAGQCGTMDLDGKCEKIPEQCLAVNIPVCGCPDKDGKPQPFSNDCKRKQAGVQLDYASECGSKK